MPTLSLVIGPWASGKTELANELRTRAPSVVLDWDLIIPGLSKTSGKDVHSDPTTWPGLRETWAAIVSAVLAGGSDLVLCGPADPEDLHLDERLGVTVRCAYLDCPDATLRERLEARGVSSQEIEDELEMAASLRTSDWYRIRVADRSSSEVADEVARWLRGPA